ncbi:hypothetical protein M2150_001731, partial [Lachnospiraceae bacterium PM6-15]
MYKISTKAIILERLAFCKPFSNFFPGELQKRLNSLGNGL